MADLEFIADYSDLQTMRRELVGVAKDAKQSAGVFEREYRKVERQLASSAKANQTFFNSVLGVDREMKSASKSADVFTRELQRQEKATEAYNKETQRLKLQYNSTYRAAQSFKTQLGELNEAHRRGAISTDRHEQQVRELKTEYRAFLNGTATGMNQFGNIASKNTRVMKRFGAVGMQQVGYQVQDFAVQVQSGTSAMVALGQQGSQLLGIFGPYGAIAGMILAIGTGLAGAFMAARDAAKDATDSIMDLKEAQDALNESTANYRSKIDQLRFGVDSEAEARVLREIIDLEEEHQRVRAQYLATDSLGAKQRLAEEALILQQKLSGLQQEADALAEIRRAYDEQLERQQYTNEMAEFFRQAQQRIQKERRQAATEEQQQAERIRAAYGEYYRSRLAGEAILQRSLRKSNTEGFRLADVLDRISQLNTTSTVGQINNIARSLRVSTREAIRLARSLPGYTSGAAPGGPDQAVAQSQELLGQGTTLVPDLSFSPPDAPSGVASGASAAADQVDRLNQALAENEKLMLSVGETVASSFGDALMSIVDGSKSAADAFRDMARKILKQAFDMLVVQPIMNSIMGAFSPGPGMSMGAASSIVSQLPQALLQANGGVWNKGVQMYANGGVVSGATAFAHSGGLGVMGEAGPEAIMPLKRGKNGKLGVQVDGESQGNITVEQHFHVHGNGDEYIMGKIQQAAPQLANYTQQQMLDQRRRGGVVKSTFG